MVRKKGLFVVFDGIDGSGKGTMIGLAAEFLKNLGIPESKILITKEPTQGKKGRRIRELLAGNEPPEAHAEELLALYVSDRRQHVRSVLEPALGSGKIVLCDRYKYSTAAYQQAQGISEKKIIEMHKGMPVPDLVFILDLPVEIALRRISDDARRTRLEKFEQKAFLEKVRQNFLRMNGYFPGENMRIIDASKPKEKVFEQIKPLLEEALAKRKSI